MQQRLSSQLAVDDLRASFGTTLSLRVVAILAEACAVVNDDVAADAVLAALGDPRPNRAMSCAAAFWR